MTSSLPKDEPATAPAPPVKAEARIPHCPGLWIVALTGKSVAGRPVSATGVGDTLELARARAHSEWAERNALASHPAFAKPCPLTIAAAHPDPAQAYDHLMAEAIERAAVALWWSGHHTARSPDAKMTDAATRAAQDWGRKPGRPVALLDLSLPDLAAVCLAWSLSDRGAVFGLGAGETRAAAVRGAFRELAQMEFAVDLDAARGTHTAATIIADQRLDPGTAPPAALGHRENWLATLQHLGADFDPVCLQSTGPTILAAQLRPPAGQQWRTPWEDST